MKILLATDDSKYSEEAAGFLASLDFSPDDEIIILHAIGSVPFQDSRQSYEAAIKADIIAVGSRGLRGIKGALGSVSRHVLNHAECSVLIGKM